LSYALITGSGRSVRVPIEGRPTAAELAFNAGFALHTACGGKGVCGRCRLFLGEGEYETHNGRRFRVAEGEERLALGCRVRPVGLVAHIRVPDESQIEQRAQIHEDFALPPGTLNSPIVRACVRPAPATLERPSDDVERLMAELRARFPDGPLSFPIELLRRLPDALIRGDGAVTVTMGPSEHGRAILDIEPGDTAGDPLLGVAADIGTTTVVCALLDLRDGNVLARASRYNQQIRKADDVASRISYCRGPAELELMQRLVVEETINPLIHEICEEAGTAPARIARMAASGNTVMMHLLLGLSPNGIGAIPFAPVLRRLPPTPARAIGLDTGPGALLDLVPAIAGYVGGDITADLYAARLMDAEGPSLLVDIGTNGEMALWDGGRLRVSATAAGPAFEGAGVRHGCRAAAGAIERFRWDDALNADFRVIGPRAPMGLCGSALIDFVAESFRVGLLDEVGRFDVDRLRAAGRYIAARDERGVHHACAVVADAESGIEGPIYVTEADVAELLKAKAAVYAGLTTLLEVSGRRATELRELVLAGGFARHIDLRNAARIGLLPDLPVERVRVIGNGALAGAVLALRDPAAFENFHRITARAETVELNLVPSFAAHFADAMILPNADPAAFTAIQNEVR